MISPDLRLPGALLLAAASLLLLSSVAHAGTDVKYCDGKKNYAVKVQGVDILPNPIVRGKLTKFTISATTGAVITGGKLVIDVSYFGFSIHEETRDLCEETSCPVSTGNFKLAHSASLPIFTPPGKYSLKMDMTDEDGKELTCITFDFNIGFGSQEVAEI